MHFLSPLRYPGGKGRIAPFLGDIASAQPRSLRHYVEPFAGGAGAALWLLDRGKVDQITINDLNPGVAALWRSIFYQTDELASLIETTNVSLELWHEAHHLYLSKDSSSDLKLGFATFILNRCNRSGILSARPIGGMHQLGKWKLDARYNRSDLASRVRYLGRLRSHVIVEELDALELISSLELCHDRHLLYIDPPYIDKGKQLYMSDMDQEAHIGLSRILRETPLSWVLTYDYNPEHIADLYAGNRMLGYNIKHTAQNQKRGQEVMLFSNSLVVPHTNVLPMANSNWLSSNFRH